ncbi:MAG: carbohydrate kinase [Armatimonadetes bacterium]|nr:carbohydrate kinase [Armatimonadota bacterium]
MSENQYNVIGLGEILWDLLPGGKELGGAPANFAYHAQALGAQSCVVSCVGADPLGDEILSLLDNAGLDRTYLAVDKNHPTGTVSVTLDANGVPSYVIHTDVAWDCIPWSNELEEVAAHADAVCFGSLCQRSAISRETVQKFLTCMPETSLRVFDINMRQSYYSLDVIVESLTRSNVMKLNDEELPILCKMLGLSMDTNEALNELVERYSLKLIALTRGSRGSILCTPNQTSEHRGYPAKIVDTVGAGDSFTAAIVMGMLNGTDLDKINDTANRLAAYVCSQKGAMPKISSILSSVEGCGQI